MTKWVVFFTTLFIIGTLISGVMEMSYIGTTQTGILYHLMNDFRGINLSNPITGAWTLISVGWSYIQNLWNVLWFNYAFFVGTASIIRIALFIPISVGFVVTLIITFIKGGSA